MRTRLHGFALITGADGGLGSAFALEAVRRGWNILLVDLPGSGAREVGERLARAYQVEAHTVTMDLANCRERERLVAWIAQQGIEVDLLINNAGTGSCGSFLGTSLSRLAGIIEVNVQAVVQMTHLLLPQLRRRPWAAIINVASLAAFYPMPSMAVYAATKSFILNFSLAIRHELAGTGVTVSALCPAGMVTNRDTADQVEAQGFFEGSPRGTRRGSPRWPFARALRGRGVIIPGLVNRLIQWVGVRAPRLLVVRLIGGWRKASSRAVKASRAAVVSRAAASVADASTV